MKITLPFAYEVTVKLPRNRNPVGRHPCSVIEVDIPVVTSQSAPVAARWIENGCITEEGKERHVRAQMEVRQFENGFYRPLVYDHLKSSPATSVDALSAYTDRGVAIQLYLVFCRDRRTQPIAEAMRYADNGSIDAKLKAGYIERNAEILDNKFEETLLGVEAALAEYIVIDGGLWKKVSEPILVLDNPSGAAKEDRLSNNPDRPDRRVGVVGIVTQPAEVGLNWSANLDRRCIGGADSTKTFRLDQFDALTDFIGSAREPRDRAGRHYQRFEMAVGEIEVLLPDAFSFDPDLNEISRQVDECLRLTTRVATDDEVLATFFKEAAAHSAAFREDGDQDHLTRVLPAVQTLYAALGNDMSDEQSAALEALFALHDKLPISLDVNPVRRPGA